MSPFIFENNDIIGLMDYRIACCTADEEGLVICDGVEYPVNRYGVMNPDLPVLNTWSKKIGEILSLQIAKRKKESPYGKPQT